MERRELMSEICANCGQTLTHSDQYHSELQCASYKDICINDPEWGITKTPPPSNEALEALDTLEHIYQTHIEENLGEDLPDDDETIFLARQCRKTIRAALQPQEGAFDWLPEHWSVSVMRSDGLIRGSLYNPDGEMVVGGSFATFDAMVNTFKTKNFNS
jgi:hypothetical protein